ncbi:MAG: MBL fold metallo-hydrolase RNA specificity domain-containing protein, partial [Pyrobaculum sp.]
VRKGVMEEPSVIITPAGMLKGGAALYYFKKIAPNKKSGIFLPSFQAPNTPGFEILGKGYAVVDGTAIKVEARLEWFDFSAHAGSTELEKFIRRFPVDTKIVFVHTDPLTSAPLVRRMSKEGYDNIYVSTTPGEELYL